ncbi:hypothetical protein [Falsiroseomonas sp.]|uniref:hypothetical protein n=1 Tax=Falsiroseomonas sp. TaxID=2870721 RepID=UPI003F6FE59D
MSGQPPPRAGSGGSDEAREAPAEGADSALLRGAPRRRDPFAHGDLPQRPIFLPEEAEARGSRSEAWAILKGTIVAFAVILFLGWLLTSR